VNDVVHADHLQAHDKLKDDVKVQISSDMINASIEGKKAYGMN